MIAVLLAAALFGQLDGGTLVAASGAQAAVRVSYELADGGVVALPAAADGGVVAIVLTPEKALALANERQQKDWELAQARAAAAAQPQPLAIGAVVLGALKLVFDAVPVVVSVWSASRQP